MGDLELRDIVHAFNRGDFAVAEQLAWKLAQRLYEPREAQCLALLAAGYGAWDQFNFQIALDKLQEAVKLLSDFSPQGRWAWTKSMGTVLNSNLNALKNLVEIKSQPARIEDGVPLLVWYLAAAERLLAAEKPSLAVLLVYAAIERYIDVCLWVDFGLDDEHPDYSRVQENFDWNAYDEAGKRFFGKDYKRRELEGPLMFSNGAQLLVALNNRRLGLEDLGILRGLASARNKCEYEHGLLPQVPSREHADKYLNKAMEILARVCGVAEALDKEMHQYRFPTLKTGTNT